ncbi:MAG: cytochrome-c oxidase, cbb3-type subunit II [Alcanivorax sp.]|uniref:Cytochrome-c oxidase, cbb3-type subunit II n=1 Tax=Alloalcanivorax marinus TaxID=1177169 RepID=A0A9Q3YPK0_9GAMM|nr:cytochrome-c oxidase, cbb3-type subunit II [Alloalcanivorax marinus]MBM7335280.1 cytochrome-c oxidase, cbb3-type subunit II [Alloalcanivorax marinus]MCC4309961.1 cytochrome-c oxidase, cbb3-type subunit II [Alloalcanivorax marinus]MCU5788310.1 cbb3-type cytochrome c oxidase subunit II [Alloalcanivorax marinus]
MANYHSVIEKNVGLMIVLTLVAVSFGGLAEIVPLFWQKATTEPMATLRPYSALEMAGRDVYIREGCHVCHTQMVRPLRAETERFGPYSVAGEDVWEHPFLWGSKRTGPDLDRVGLRPITEQWHREHLRDPRQVVPESNMPAYPWLAENTVDWSHMERTLKVFKNQFGVPYSDQDIDEQMNKVRGEWADATEEDAVVAYLLSLGQARREER